MQLNDYHFDLGDSNVGQIGFCARVIATTPQEAVCLLRAALWEQFPGQEIPVPIRDDDGNRVDQVTRADKGIGYVCIYLNPDNITVDHIDEFEPVEDEVDDLVR